MPLLHDPSIFPTAHFGSQALASLPAVWPACMHPCSPHAPAGVFTSSHPLWTVRSRRRTDVGARRHDTPLPGTLSPFPSFCFSRNLRARKQRVFELPPCSSAPIFGGCVGLWYTLAPDLFAALSRTFRRHPGGSSGRTRGPASASGAHPLPLAALRRSAAGCALAPHNSSPCAGPRAPLTLTDPAGALAQRLPSASGPPAFSCFGCLGLSTAVTTPLVVCQ